MDCYKNTQCVPLKYLCDSSDPCTDSDRYQDPDDHILCQDQLCTPKNFLPLGFGKMRGSSLSECLKGSYYSLFGTVPKYTLSCVLEPYQNTPTECEPWEYAAQGFCFLSTCGPGLDCQPPFNCQKLDSNDLYGTCTDPSGSPRDMGNTDQSGNGMNTRHSAKEYLIQGLLIGIFSVALGIGLGVGFWFYKRKRIGTRWAQSERNGTDSTKGLPWFSRIIPYERSRSSNTINPTVDPSVARESRDSIMDSESINGSFMDVGRSTNISSGRWRWAQGNGRLTRAMAPGAFNIFPEMDPPPMYHNGPGLPTYDDSTEEIVLTSVSEAASNGQRDGNDSRPVSSHTSIVVENIEAPSHASISSETADRYVG
ncbi:hypothetical protein BGX27_007234 [Mortierella sp. AM989]|nr:hypothetical protein BGX27_007234 [Mortierella sp. AM989]